MKIGLDISRLHPLSRNRGIGVYAKNLFDSLKKYTEIDVELIEEKMDYSKFDLIHYPFFDFFSHSLKTDSDKPFVVTIHDLIPVMFPKHYPPGIKGRINWLWQKQSLRNAVSVITVSNAVKNDIEKKLDIDPKKISVIYSAPSEKFYKITDEVKLEQVKNKYHLPQRFVLYVGNVNWNKNILNTTEAVLDANKKLVIVGNSFLDKTNLDHPEKKSFKIWLDKYGNDERIKTLGFMETEEIVLLMNLAECLIFVSLAEGFGLPILEAQACKLPVITSNIPATAEIAGEGAVLVDPESVTNISVAVRNLFDNNNLKEQVIRAGVENLSRFSWEKTAINTAKVYERSL